MGFDTISDGLTLVIPQSTQTNWARQVKELAWKKISAHRHEASGDGNQIRLQGLNPNFGIPYNSSSKTVSANAVTINWNEGSRQTVDLSAATGGVTFTFSNPITGGHYVLILDQDTPARTITWPAAVLWEAGTEPTQSHTDGSKNMVILDYDGTNYLGRSAAAFA